MQNTQAIRVGQIVEAQRTRTSPKHRAVVVAVSPWGTPGIARLRKDGTIREETLWTATWRSVEPVVEEQSEEAVETLAATDIATHPSERDGEAPEYLDEASAGDRDPADPDAVTDELAAWIEAQSSDDETERDEADASLDGVLLEQGVICPTDVIDWITWGDDFVTIGLAGGEEIRISRTTGELAS